MAFVHLYIYYGGYRSKLGLSIFFDFPRVLGEMISYAGGTCGVFR